MVTYTIGDDMWDRDSICLGATWIYTSMQWSLLEDSAADVGLPIQARCRRSPGWLAPVLMMW